MYSVRDVIKAAIEFACEELEAESYVAEKLHKKFCKLPLVRDVTEKQLSVVKRPPKVRTESSILVARLNPEELKTALIVAEMNKVHINDLFSISRKRANVDARLQMVALYFIYFNYTLSAIGKIVDKDHSTIIHNIRVNQDLLDTNINYKTRFYNIINKCKLVMPEIYDINLDNLESNEIEFQLKTIKRQFKTYQKTV
jgi:chromosomal replication initiation ATPase DnaA